MNARTDKGMTLVEMLIAMAILGIVLLITSSGIIQSLQVNRLTEEAANTQSKLRRITEVVSQELRSAVMGGLTNFPVPSSGSSVSFALLSGDGGFPVTVNPRRQATGVYASDPAVLQDLVGSPALIIDGAGRAILIDEIDGVIGSELQHSQCTIPIDHPVNTRLYAASALGFSYDDEAQILYQHTLDRNGRREVPFAFGLSRFELAYEYVSDAGSIRLLNTPERDPNTNLPVLEFEGSGSELYQLVRLRLTLASQSEQDAVEREYVTFVELTGIGNDARNQRTISEFVPCGDPVIVEPEPEPEPDPTPGGGDDDDGGGDDGDGGGDDDDGGDDGDGGGDDDDDGDDDDHDDDDSCDKILEILC